MTTVTRLAVFALLVSGALAVGVRKLDGHLFKRGGSDGHRKLHQAPPASAGDIPKQCMDSGLNLQSACSDDISKATTFFGVSGNNAAGSAPVQISQAKLDAFIANPNNNPTASCCQAATVFNANRCSCDKNVLELVKSFTNNDISVYGKISDALAKTCKFRLIYGPTCAAPAAKQRG